MSYNGSGTFQINTSGQPVVTGTVISSSAFNALTADLATGLSTAITKDGQTTTTARIPFAQGINSSLATDTTNGSSGSIYTAGGVGIAKALFVGTNATVAGALGITGVTTVQAGTAAAPAITTSGDTNTGIFFPAADTIAFTEGGVESMRIDSSGNVGIGTSSPAAKLELGSGTLLLTNNVFLQQKDSSGNAKNVAGVNSSNQYNFGGLDGSSTIDTIRALTAGSERMRIDSSGNVGIGISAPVTKLDVSGAASATPVTNGIVRILTTGSNPPTGYGGGLLFTQINSGGSNQDYASITGSRVNSTANNKVDLVFATGDPTGSVAVAERMRIDTSGYLLVNQTSNTTNSYVQIYGAQPALSVESTSTGGVNQIIIRNPNGTVGSISTSGSSTAFNTSSDYRLKNTIAPMTGALAKVALLKPCTYKWNVDGSDGQGFIAHELDEVVPGCVTGEKDAVDENGNPQYQGIDVSFLVATLTAAIQEQQALITSLTARIAALESK